MNTPPDFTPPAADPKRHRLISLNTLIQAFHSSIERFPLSLAYLLALSVWGILTIWMKDIPSQSFFMRNVQPAMWFLVCTGMMLSLAVSLWCEQSGKERLTKPAQWAANIILWLDFIYILLRVNTFTTSQFVAQGAIVTALAVGMLFVPPLRHTPPRHSLMFSFKQCGNLIDSLGISFVMGIAVSMIWGTVSLLFSFNDFRVHATLLILGCASLSVLVFIGRVPTFDETVEMVTSYNPTKFVVGTIKYLLLPLIAIYTIILYVYGIKIIIAWELPDGGICIMVTALTAGVYGLLFLLKAISSSSQGDDRLTTLSLRIFPLALIPLLVMMSVAIGVRIADYGITVPRLYMLTFNIWAYITAIYLFITSSRNTNIVALSFAVIFLLTSIMPGANYTALVHRHLRSEVFKALNQAGVDSSQYPLSKSAFETALDNMDDNTAEDVKSKLCYLDTYDNHSSVDDIVDFKIWESSYLVSPTFRTRNGQTYTESQRIVLNFGNDTRTVAIPAGFSNVRTIHRYNNDVTVPESGIISLELSNNINTQLDFNMLRSLNPDTINEPIELYIDKEQPLDSMVIVCHIEYWLKNYSDSTVIGSIETDGMLFTH